MKRLTILLDRSRNFGLNFRVKILRELKKIKLAWLELNYSTAPGVLILLPSVPTIPPVESSPRLAR